MGILYRILKWAGIPVGIALSAWGYFLDWKDSVSLGLQPVAWMIAGYAVFVLAVIGIIYGQHRDSQKIKSSNQQLQNTVNKLEASFTSTVPSKEPTLMEEFQQSKVVWALWYAGTKARADKVLDVSIPMKILLLRPNANNKALQRVIKEAGTPLDEILADVKFLTKRALDKKDRIQVGWFTDYIGYTLTIYDKTPIKGKKGELIPTSDNAWLVRTQLDPKVGAGERTRERIYNKGKDAGKFQGYLETYKGLWNKRVRVRLKDGNLIED